MHVEYFGPRGPYGTELEAIGSTGQSDWAPGTHRDRNLNRLTSAAANAGVELGSYDMRILTWLAGFEPQAVEVIAAIVDRAAGRQDTVIADPAALPVEQPAATDSE
jgi:hypothetical protein